LTLKISSFSGENRSNLWTTIVISLIRGQIFSRKFLVYQSSKNYFLITEGLELIFVPWNLFMTFFQFLEAWLLLIWAKNSITEILFPKKILTKHLSTSSPYKKFLDLLKQKKTIIKLTQTWLSQVRSHKITFHN